MNSIRRLSIPIVMLHGLVLGVATYFTAEMLVPLNVHTAGMHDLYLAVRLGLIFPPLVGLWLGWLYRSVAVAVLGVIVGVVVGAIYSWLCVDEVDFLHISISFPCICGGVYAVLVPSNPSGWATGLVARLIKGLVAGFVLGSVYFVVLNAGALFILGIGVPHKVDRYVAMMWRVGPVALGTATALFLPLLVWAVGQAGVFNPAGADSAETEPKTKTTL
ncbi:MAG: hypothetical protein QM775_28335 [Pirellulales bacterium]